jgi:CheY-like chemotaxis protein
MGQDFRKTYANGLLEPYVTTREKGTGLGLAIVNRIIADHGGSISLQNRLDGLRGARVRIWLPPHDPATEQIPAANARCGRDQSTFSTDCPRRGANAMALDILVVDDEPDIRELIAGVLGDEGYSVRTAATAEAALEEVRTRTPRLVVLDVWLQGSGMDGLSLLKYLKSIDPLLPVIVISGHGNIETAVAAIRRGAYDFIEKPFKTDRLLHLIDRAIESAALKYENAALPEPRRG